MREELLDQSKGTEREFQAGRMREYLWIGRRTRLRSRSKRKIHAEMRLRRGEIPHIRVGRRFILPKAAIAEWLRTAGGPAQCRAPAPTIERPRSLLRPGHTEVTVMRPAKGRA